MYKAIATGALKAVAVSVAGNALLFYAFHAAGVLSDTVMIPNANGPLNITMILISSCFPVLAGAIFYLLLARFTKRPMRFFRPIALTLLLLSLYSPFSIPQVPIGMALVLIAMHLVSGGSLLFLLPDVRKES